MTQAPIEEKPTGELRWRGNPASFAHTLQQRWQIIEYHAGAPSNQRFEWRDVPQVED